jgi:hypothetical protein
MVDLDKNEYVYLMIVRTQGTSRRAIDYNVHPFKTANDVKRAILNVITNNIKNYRDDIAYISYDIGSISDANNYGCARIEYKNGVSKTYNAIRRRIEEVK